MLVTFRCVDVGTVSARAIRNASKPGWVNLVDHEKLLKLKRQTWVTQNVMMRIQQQQQQQQQQPFILMRLFFPVYWGQPRLWPSHNILLHLYLSQASSLQSLFFSYLLSTLLSISSWAYLSLHHHLPAVSQFSLSNTTHLSSQHGQTTSACFIASLQQCHQLPACSSHTHYFSFHLNSLLSSISTSSFHSSAFSLYPLSLLACLTAIQHCRSYACCIDNSF